MPPRSSPTKRTASEGIESPTKKVKPTTPKAKPVKYEQKVLNEEEQKELDEEIRLSHILAEKEAILLHNQLNWSYEDARSHLIGVDDRFRILMDRMKCKPFEGDPTDTFNPFRSLTTSIIGQQISWLAALSVTNRFVSVFFPLHDPKIKPSPFPTATMVATMSNQVDRLRGAGLSRRKVEYIIELSQRFHDGRLSAEVLLDQSDEEISKSLLAVRGLGPWSVDMFKIFTMKRADVMPFGDLAIQKNILKWFSMERLQIDSVKLEKEEKLEKEITPPLETSPFFNSITAPETPSKLITKIKLEDEEIPTLFIREREIGNELLFPICETLKSPAECKARLGKKLKGNIYMSPKEMTEMTAAWKPYSSTAVWFLWSVADGDGGY